MLWVAAVVGTVSVFVVPVGLAALRGFAGEKSLVVAASTSFVRAESEGSSGRLPLTTLVDFWREFHLVKAGLAVTVVVILALLASALGRAALAAGDPGRRRLVAAYGAVLLWALGTLTVALANLQGAIAPLSSVASLLPTGRFTGELAATLGNMRSTVLADPTNGGDGIAHELLHDFTLYHAAFALMAGSTGVLLAAQACRAAMEWWQARRRREPASPTWIWRVALFGTAGALFLAVAVANAGTWIHPEPALVASLGGALPGARGAGPIDAPG